MIVPVAVTSSVIFCSSSELLLQEIPSMSSTLEGFTQPDVYKMEANSCKFSENIY